MEDFGFPPVFPDDTEAIEGATADDAIITEVDLTKKPKKVRMWCMLCDLLTDGRTDGWTGEKQSCC